MAFAVVLDACVLHSAPVRDLLIRLARTGVFRARWTEQILDEVFRSILARRPDLDANRLARTRALLNQAVPDCLVVGYEPLIGGVTLPDPDDRHVLAAAIKAGAEAIVTFNLKDFPGHMLAAHDVEAIAPDEFVLDVIDLAPAVVVTCVREQAAALTSPRRMAGELLDILLQAGMPRTVAKLRDLGLEAG
jgi:predicted nucleic acid-binding protein